MNQLQLLDTLADLRQDRSCGEPAPHKPLLLLTLFGRLQSTRTSRVDYAEVRGPLSALITEVIGDGAEVEPSTVAGRAKRPLKHLESTLWDDRGSHGVLRPEVERLLLDPENLDDAVALVLRRYLPEESWQHVLEATGLGTGSPFERALQELSPRYRTSTTTERVRETAFRSGVLLAYAHTCAMCGYWGLIAEKPVGIEAAHVRSHAEQGPDTVDNGLALCSLHHTLFDRGVLGLTPARTVLVSPDYSARGDLGRAVEALRGAALAVPRASYPPVAEPFIRWHTEHVFRG
ncbi:HNH endonuclease [Kitasatospora sp. NPDC096147]|uniref:HNH endonuclease n=1 Tax=Kitasatospora sp. NPDC096147 TaxID=3364093 RepID=UPI003814101E